MPLVITPLYAGLLSLFYIYLSFRVVRQRYQSQVSIGTGDDRMILRKMRVHANFAEYAPLALLLIGFFELSGGFSWMVHLLGLSLLIGRVAHAYALSQEPDDFRFRRFGMILTFGVLITAGAANILNSLQNLLV